MSLRCHLCPYVAFDYEDMGRHVKRTHRFLKEEERRKAMLANPVQALHEKGFDRELLLVAQGKCPRCANPCVIDETTPADAIKEWQKSYLCPKCFAEIKAK